MSRLAPDRWAAVAMFAVAALTPLVVRDAFLLDSVILILLWGALSAAWNVAGGYAGQVSLGHAAFFGIGAYAAALMSARYAQSPWLGLVVGVALSVVAGALIASLIVAAVEVIGSYVIGTAWKEVLYLLLFIGILVVRPAGLFGQRGAEAIGA